MPIPHLKKRSYGYIHKEEKKEPQKPERKAGRPQGGKDARRHLNFGPTRPGRPPKKPGRQTAGRLRRFILLSLLTAGVVGFLAFTILVAWVSRDVPNPDKLTDREVAQSTKIYDRSGEHLLYEIFSDEKRTLVELEDLPEYLVQGVIATEDTAFFEHKGIRPLSIVRSVVSGLLGRARVGSGASTLTQQLVKNAILTNERTITRKIKEIILSVRLEQKYSKDQILKIYFNEIPYGSTNYGVESAAQSYFGKQARDLKLSEAATLAGMPKAPSRFLADHNALLTRRNFVLKRMFEEGYISEQEKNEAQSEPLELEQRLGNISAPHFVLYVKEQLVEKFGEQMVDTGGLKVITTLDWDMQNAAEGAVSTTAELFSKADADNAALVAMNPKTGEILAMVGSRDYFNDDIDGQFNVAVQGLRQPGSSFKPIVYAAAFEMGYTPETVLFDVETNFAVAGDDYEPKNYDLQERGPVTMRQALQGSLNIPSVKTLYLVGDKKGVEFAERMGYSSLSAGDFGLSLVLGGGEVRLLEHVRAYGIFAAEGIKQNPFSIVSVEDSRGDTLFEWKPEQGERVLERDLAARMSEILSDDESRAYIFGAGGVLTLPDRPVAGKTGTTNGFVDAWTVGYTPSLVAGVWAGNTDNTPMKQGFGGSKIAGSIWNSFMREALKGTPAEQFPDAPVNDADKPALRGTAGGRITLLIDTVTGKIATSGTPVHFIEERSFIQPHSILHYVKKDDPRGAAPSNPSDDPQYEIWEAAIRDWVVRSKEKNPDWNIIFSEPPTQTDDSHSLEMLPTLSILYPSEGAALSSRQIDTDIRVSAPRGVAKVSYKIDGRFVGVVFAHPFNLNYFAATLEPGEHTLAVIAEDDVGNRNEQSVLFVLSAPAISPSVSFLGGDAVLAADNFPKTFLLSHYKLDQISSVRIVAQKEDTLLTIADIADFANLFNNQISATWSAPPETGLWTLTARITLTNGAVADSSSITVTVK